MVLAVEERHLDILYRKARDRAGAHRLLDALLDRGDEAARAHVSLDRVDEREPPPEAKRLYLDVAICELAASAGLLLVARARPGPRLDRLPVGDVRLVELHLGSEALLDSADDHLDVNLGDPGQNLLAGLVVAVEVDGWILF